MCLCLSVEEGCRADGGEATPLYLSTAHISIIIIAAASEFKAKVIHLNLLVHVVLAHLFLPLFIFLQPGHVLLVLDLVDQLHEWVVA